MAHPATVLVATENADRGHRLAAAAHDGGFETLRGSTADSVLRAAVGSAPDVIVMDAAMTGLEGFALHEKLSFTGLDLPVIVLLFTDGEPPRQAPPDGLHVLVGLDTEPARVMQAVRLVLLADEIEGQLAGGLKLLHGDLTRSSFEQLILALRRQVVTGTVSFRGAQIAGLAVEDGVLVDAWCGPVRGEKAFHRLAGRRTGSFSFAPGRVTEERTLDADPGELLEASRRQRQVFEEAVVQLPPLDSRLEVRLTPEFFELSFSAVERAVMARVQATSNLRELFDSLDADDSEIACAVRSLNERGVLCGVEPAGRVHVVTDSTSDLALPDARRLGIRIAPVSLVLGSEVLKDGVDPAPDEVYRPRAADRISFETRPVTPGEFQDLFETLVPTGDVLAVLCSSELSATCDHARSAVAEGRDRLIELRRAAGSVAEPRVVVVDSGQCSGPLGMTAVFAGRMLASGMGIDAVARKIAAIGRRWRTLILVPDLERLGRGLRAAAGAGGGAGGWWLVSLEDGALRLADPVDPSSARAVLADRLLDTIDRDRPVFLTLAHASAPGEIAALRTLLRARLQVTELWELQMGAAVAVQTGPGAVGAAVFQPHADEMELLTERG
jgi:DegV family protein with EDD domain